MENMRKKDQTLVLDYYFNGFSESKFDQYYGIYDNGGIHVMGKKDINSMSIRIYK